MRTAAILYLVLILAGVVGWFINLVKIFTMSWEALTAELIIRIVGVPVAIIGMVAGWF